MNLGPSPSAGPPDRLEEPGLGDEFDWAWVEHDGGRDRLNLLTMRANAIRHPVAALIAGWASRPALSDGRGWACLLLMPSLLLVRGRDLSDRLGDRFSFRQMRLNRPDLGTGYVGLMHYLALPTTRSSGSRWRTPPLGRWTVTRELLLGMAAALIFTCLLGFRLFGVLVLLPWFLPNVVAGNMWALMLDPRLGVINDMLVQLGILAVQGMVLRSGHSLVGRRHVEAWYGFPFFALLFIAGLKGIPKELYEAAAIDGAALRQFRSSPCPCSSDHRRP